jgi:hypothetical protein
MPFRPQLWPILPALLLRGVICFLPQAIPITSPIENIPNVSMLISIFYEGGRRTRLKEDHDRAVGNCCFEYCQKNIERKLPSSRINWPAPAWQLTPFNLKT